MLMICFSHPQVELPGIQDPVRHVADQTRSRKLLSQFAALFWDHLRQMSRGKKCFAYITRVVKFGFSPSLANTSSAKPRFSSELARWRFWRHAVLRNWNNLSFWCKSVSVVTWRENSTTKWRGPSGWFKPVARPSCVAGALRQNYGCRALPFEYRFRFCKFLQMHRSAIVIQKSFRAHRARSSYLKLRFTVIWIQSRFRGDSIRGRLRRVPKLLWRHANVFKVNCFRKSWRSDLSPFKLLAADFWCGRHLRKKRGQLQSCKNARAGGSL